MRTSQLTVECPECGEPAVLTLIDDLGDDSSPQELQFTGVCGHTLDLAQRLELWAAAHQ